MMGACQTKTRVIRIKKHDFKKDHFSSDDLEPDNDIMYFLIVLSEADFETTCFPFQKTSVRIKKSGQYMSGKLDVISIGQVSQRNEHGKKRYNINEITNLKTLYIRLPKENVYVKSDIWQFEYMKSQIREIVHIFGLLGAKSVTYEVLSKHSESFQFSSEVSMGNFPINSGITVNNKNGNSTEISGNIIYPTPTRFLTEEEIKNADDIYYLIRKDDWQDVCARRIFHKATQDNFTYKFNTDIAFSMKVTEKLKNLGISFSVGSDEVKNFTMKFNVDYYTEEEIEESSQHHSTKRSFLSKNNTTTVTATAIATSTTNLHTNFDSIKSSEMKIEDLV